jgi:hypothetical protein
MRLAGRVATKYVSVVACFYLAFWYGNATSHKLKAGFEIAKTVRKQFGISCRRHRFNTDPLVAGRFFQRFDLSNFSVAGCGTGIPDLKLIAEP